MSLGLEKVPFACQCHYTRIYLTGRNRRAILPAIKFSFVETNS